MDKNNQEFFDKMLELTGKTDVELNTLYVNSGLSKHSEIRSYFMEQLNLSYGYANTLVHLITKSDGSSMAIGKDLEVLLNAIYDDKKINLRPIHDLIMTEIEAFGEFEIAPKKGYISLKRKRQFAMIGPKTNTRMEIGLNIKDISGTDRLLEQPKGSMCKFIVKITTISEVDSELIGWIKEAYLQSN